MNLLRSPWSHEWTKPNHAIDRFRCAACGHEESGMRLSAQRFRGFEPVCLQRLAEWVAPEFREPRAKRVDTEESS